MNIRNSVLLGVMALTCIRGSAGGNQDPVLEEQLQQSVFSLTMVMMHDVVNPPAASRYYAYCTMGALSIVAQHNKSVISPRRYIAHFPEIHIAAKDDQYDYQVAALYCILESGRMMLPSGHMLDEKIARVNKICRERVKSRKKLDNSIAVAREVAEQVVAWSRTDHYGELSTLPRYRPTENEANWFPTPPAYMEAIEPHWNTMRTMVIDSATQFIIAPPVAFDTSTSSEFYRIAYEVYETVNTLTPEQTWIASFWDCNPFVVANTGHLSLGFKKITPGGHWMNITSILSRKTKIGFDRSVEALALQGATLYDAFICCWDEKYRSDRVRPETFINRHIDIKWQPILQTPPFPEYTSGHSVISTAAAELLTYLLGDSVSFRDDTEMMFEIEPRVFPSARAAAREAAISRLYGGIHYIDAIRLGQEQGREVGHYVVQRIRKAGVLPYNAPQIARAGGE